MRCFQLSHNLFLQMKKGLTFQSLAEVERVHFVAVILCLALHIGSRNQALLRRRASCCELANCLGSSLVYVMFS